MPPEPIDDPHPEPDGRAKNLANWEQRVAVHAASDEYGLDRYVTDPSHRSDVVRFDEQHLPDLHGLDVVHLQCHIGTDTVSLARLGARVTGVDFSPAALDVARDFAARAGAGGARFVESDVFDAPEQVGATFDVVYTGVGAINWLPSIERWAGVVAALLRPGGLLHLREGHPMLWTIDETRTDDVLDARFPYFEVAGGTTFDTPGTYTDGDHSAITSTATQEWNHGLGEILTALLDRGFAITRFMEHRTLPWEALPGKMERVGPFDEWRMVTGGERLPLSYTLQARKSV